MLLQGEEIKDSLINQFVDDRSDKSKKDSVRVCM